MKKILLFASILLAFAGCAGPITEEISFGDIVGVVYDKNVGEPISVAQIQLSPGGNSTVTGSDGRFSFNNIEAGKYTVTVTKRGYNDGSNTVNVVEGKTVECNLLMERIPAYVTADKKELDFGENQSMTTLSFNIVNSSYENLSWHIDYDKSEDSFIKEVSPSEGTTQYGKTAVIVVKIDRDKLKAGSNETTLVVVSDNGDGSSEVIVKAIGQEKSRPELVMLGVNVITSSSALVSAEIRNPGNPSYFERGFLYSTSSDPTKYTAEKVRVDVSEETMFSTLLKNLAYDKDAQYYARAYAVNGKDSVYTYSAAVSFSMEAKLPEVVIRNVDNIDASSKTATIYGAVEYKGDPEYNERGFVYCEGLKTPTLDDSFEVVPGSGEGPFNATIQGLKLGATYSVRAYAKSRGGVGYSKEEKSFSVSGTLPIVSVSEAEVDLDKQEVILRGSLDALGSPKATEKGFVYSETNTKPNINDRIVPVDGIVQGSYYAVVANLSLGKTYYYRAYAKSDAGIAYSSEDETKSFSTQAILPQLTIKPVSNINLTEGTALFQGYIESIGQPAYTERGFVYSETNDSPTLNDKTIKVSGSDSGSFETTASGLSLGKTYHVKAYAVNPGGVAYSEKVEFLTIPTKAEVTMRGVTNKNRETLSALFQGSIDNIGNPEYTEKGFVYSETNEHPTLNDKFVIVSGRGVGTFESLVNNLVLDTKYYVRAYVTNAAGTAYSTSVDFNLAGTTPIVGISDVSEIDLASQTALLNGYVEELGYPVISERGFVYSYDNSAPTINDSKVVGDDPVMGGSYSIRIANLVLDKTYNVRAYVKNTGGFYYSETKKFSTETTLPSLSIGQASEVDPANLTATVSGSIDNPGNPAFTQKGFVYSYVNEIPTLENDSVVTLEGSQAGTMITVLSNLVLDKTYYVRAYAKNVKGVAYSPAVSFTIEETLPVVITNVASNVDVDNRKAVLHGSISDTGNPSFTERGFVLSTEYEQPTIYDQKLIVSGTSHDFEYRLTDFSTETKTYIRAYAINHKGVAYGETVVLFDPAFVDKGEYIELRSAGIAVQKEDIGYGTHSAVGLLCSNSIRGGYSDWRLPTVNELALVINNYDEIGGFNNLNSISNYSWYWCSANTSQSGIVLQIVTGEAKSVSYGSYYSGRCVRTLE